MELRRRKTYSGRSEGYTPRQAFRAIPTQYGCTDEDLSHLEIGCRCDEAAAQRLGAEPRRPVDQYAYRADSNFQKRYDLARRAAASATAPCWTAAW